MAVVLLTGMSGVGKSTVLGELARLGHAVVDTDDDGWTEPGVPPGGGPAEPLWREDRVAGLVADHRARGGAAHLVLAGTVPNQGRLYPAFDAVVLLSAPLDVLLARLDARTGNDFGKHPDERARVVADHETVEPLLRRGATVEIDTRAPLADVVRRVLAVADGA